MTQVLNFSVSSFQVLIGELDVTNALSGFGASHNAAEVGEPLIWSGALQLTNPLPPYQLTESLDNLINPGRWAKGAHPVKLYINGQLFLTLRILDYNYDPDAQTAEATLTDKLGLVKSSGGTKDKPLEGFIPSAELSLQGKPTVIFYPWTEVAQAIATQGSTIEYRTIISPSDVILPTPNGAAYSNPPHVKKDMVAQLASIASASANLWVWCDKNERIRFVAYPNLGSSPSYCLSRKQIEEFKRVPPSPDDEVTSVEVEGESAGIAEIPEREISPNDLATPINPNFGDDDASSLTADPSDFKMQISSVAYPITIESPKGGDFMKRQTIYGSLSSGTVVARREQTLARADAVIPDSTDSTSIISEEIYTEERYQSTEGKIISRRTVKVEPLGKVASEAFPKETARITSEDTKEDFYYNGDGTPLERIAITSKPQCVIFSSKKYGTGRVTAQKVVETWAKLYSDATGAKYLHSTVIFKTKGELYPDKFPGDTTLALSPDSPAPEITDAQPDSTHQEPRTPVEIKNSTFSREFDNSGDSEGSETKVTITLSDIPDRGNVLDQVAETAGNIRRQRIGAHDISHPLRQEDLLNYQPFKVVDIHTGRFVRDEFSIAFGDDRELSCFFSGNFMGSIAAVPDQPTQLLIRDGGSVSVSVTQNAAIAPIKLQSGEGIAPYSYNVSGLPSGITLSGNELSGTPTGTGTTSATVTVTDGASNSYSYLLIFNSSAAPAAIAHYCQIMRLKGETQYQGAWALVDTPRTSEIVASSTIAKYQGLWQTEVTVQPLQATIYCTVGWTVNETGWNSTSPACSFGQGKLLKATRYKTGFAHPINVQLSGLSASGGIQVYKTSSSNSSLTPSLFIYVTTLPTAGSFQFTFTTTNDVLSFRVKNPASRNFTQANGSVVTITNFWDAACISWDEATQTVTLGGF